MEQTSELENNVQALELAGTPLKSQECGLLGLPLDCLRLIFDLCIEYDESSHTNLQDATRIRLVCR